MLIVVPEWHKEGWKETHFLFRKCEPHSVRKGHLNKNLKTVASSVPSEENATGLQGSWRARPFKPWATCVRVASHSNQHNPAVNRSCENTSEPYCKCIYCSASPPNSNHPHLTLRPVTSKTLGSYTHQENILSTHAPIMHVSLFRSNIWTMVSMYYECYNIKTESFFKKLTCMHAYIHVCLLVYICICIYCIYIYTCKKFFPCYEIILHTPWAMFTCIRTTGLTSYKSLLIDLPISTLVSYNPFSTGKLN